MRFQNVEDLLRNKMTFAGIMNQLFRIIRDQYGNNPWIHEQYESINPVWIDEIASEKITRVYEGLVPPDIPVMSIVKVVQDPEWCLIAMNETDLKRHLRYILVQIIGDDCEGYRHNFGLFTDAGIMALRTWEVSRETLEYERNYTSVPLQREKLFPVINEAKIVQVALCVGSDGFSEIEDRRVHFIREENELERKAHLLNIRLIEDNPFIGRLISAYDLDIKTESNTAKA